MFPSCARRAISALLLTLAFPTLPVLGCTPLPASSDCSGGGCCTSVTGPGAEWISIAQQRTGVVSSLVTQLSSAYPVEHMLGMYDVRTIPISADVLDGKPLALVVSLHVFRIFAVNQKSQSYEMHYELKWEWRDCRMLFNCSDILRVSKGDPTYESFWRPAWRILEREDEIDSMATSVLDFGGHGQSLSTEEHVSKFRCSFEFQEMPFDEQTCTLTLSLPGLVAKVVTFDWDTIDSNRLTTVEWEISDVSTWSKSSSVVTKPGTSRLPSSEVVELEMEFRLKRIPGFLHGQFIAQAVLFYVLSWVGLWIDVGAAPARVAAGVIPALTTSNKMSALASILPPIPYKTRLDDFMKMTLHLIVLHFVEYGIVHMASKRLKAFAELDKKQKDQAIEQGDSVDKVASDFERFQRRALTVVNNYFEILTRLLSPLIYVVAGLVILYG